MERRAGSEKTQASYWSAHRFFGSFFFFVFILGYGLEGRDSIPGRGLEGIIFLFSTATRPTLGPAEPLIQ